VAGSNPLLEATRSEMRMGGYSLHTEKTHTVRQRVTEWPSQPVLPAAGHSQDHVTSTSAVQNGVLLRRKLLLRQNTFLLQRVKFFYFVGG